ncbi:MAG: hypothetical protein C4522_14000 [Desulfobacteraceae bacterium]|nr:MAG: hypothetical protein C4522_14000 [Desulfobacteraceae bacterium]
MKEAACHHSPIASDRSAPHDFVPEPEQGAVLLALVILMVMIGFLGAAMTHQAAIGELGTVMGNRSQQAYYLAESGYRYAAAKMKKRGDLNTLHDHGPYAIDRAGTFTIRFYPYIFDARTTDGAGTVTAEVPFGDAPPVSRSAGSGYFFYLKTAFQTEPFQTISVSDDTISFIKDTGVWNIFPSERVRLVVKSNGDVPTEGGDLNLQPTSPADAFPLRHGRILVDGKTYHYKLREASKLTGVVRADNQFWEAPVLVNGSDIVLLDFLELRSVGTVGSGLPAVSQEVVYNIPVYGDDHEEFYDRFDDKSHWEETSTQGSHGIESVDGGNVLKVDSTAAVNTESKSQIALAPSTTNVDLARAYQAAGDFLSYDTQVKIGFSPDIPDHYMAGISFRLNGTTGNHLGVSLQKPDFHFSHTGAQDRIPDTLVPNAMENQFGIVLWREIASGWDWLAYKKLLPMILFQDDMEGGNSAWGQTGTWGKSSWAYNSAFSLTDSVSGNYSNNQETALVSNTIDLTHTRSVSLSFVHYYSIEPPYAVTGGWTDYGAVEISNNDGATWTEVARFANWWWSFLEISQNSWKQETFAIPDAFLSDRMKIRFRLVTDYSVTRDGWYIDNVRLSSTWFPEKDATLMVRLVEAAAVEFTNGVLPGVEDGDILISQTDGTRGIAAGNPILHSGSYAGGDAAGIIRLNNLSAAGFPNGAVSVAGKGTGLANVTGFRARDNYIQVYYADPYGYGTPNYTPLDIAKHPNPRMTAAGQVLKWPPADVNHTEPSNDYFTIVQWDGYNPSAATRLGNGLEAGTIIRTDLLTTGAGYNPDPEIGLHTFGKEIYSTSVYFDDFGLRTNLPALQGFLPAVQE